MKKFLSVIISTALILCIFQPFFAMAEESSAPTLKSISFNGATLDDELKKNAFEYTITLTNPTESPTLNSYKIDGNANLFMNYSVDDNNSQDGIVVTLEYDNGAIYYNFKYSNAVAFNESDNNFLKDVNCNLGEVYPKINENDTSYKLYIPNDLTEINLTATTEELSAIADYPSTIVLNDDQEYTIPILVTASNGAKREYSFKVKRLSKNCDEIKEEMAKPNFKSIVYGELFYQKPEFAVGIACAIGGILILIGAGFISKRIMIKVGDDDEEEFFD